MPRKIDFKLHTIAPEWWDKTIEENYGVYTSTSKWAKSYEQMGIGKGLYLEILIDNKRSILVLIYEVLIGGVLLLNFPKVFLQAISKINFLRSMNMHLQPVILDKNFDEETFVDISVDILKYINSLAESRNVNIMPADFVCFRSLDNAKNLKSKIYGSDLIATVRIPLDFDIDNKLESLPGDLRRQIRRSEQFGIEVKEAEAKDFYEYLKISWKSYGLSMNPVGYYVTLVNESHGEIKYYLAYSDGKVLAGSAIMYCGKTMSEFSMFATKYSREAKIPGGDALKWHLLKVGNIKGYDFMDLSMINVNDESSEKIQNINQYKLKWGGYVLYGITISKLNTLMQFIQKLKLQILGK